MLTKFRIEGFRRFRHLEFSKLKRVNLIAGKNNTGKTGVLEALIILLEQNWHEVLQGAFRNCSNLPNSQESYWRWLFYNHSTNVPIVLSADSDKLQNYSLAVACSEMLGKPMPPKMSEGWHRISPINLIWGQKWPELKGTGQRVQESLRSGTVCLSLRPNDPQKDAMDYDRVVLKSTGEERVEGLLRKIEPRLKNIRSIKPHGMALLYVDIGLPEKVPSIHFGQGFIRLLSIYSEIIASGKKVLLIDEIENGLHYSVLTEIWRGLLVAAEQENVQIFATTHSYECIKAAHAAFAETMDYDFALHRLDERDGEVQVVTYSKDELETSLQNNFEIR